MSATVREVFGPVKPGTRKDWWEATKVGAPLTPRMAYHLRRGMPSSTPKTVLKAFAERGLMSEPTSTRVDPWTELGERARRLLGRVPEHYWPRQAHYRSQLAPSEGEFLCPACDRYISVELYCWDDYDGAPDARDPACINCRLTEEP